MDQREFEEQLEALGPDLRAFFMKKGFGAEEAADLAQDTLLRALRGREGYREDGEPRHWVFSIAVNVARNKIRFGKAGKRAGVEVPLDDTERPAPQIPDRSDPEKNLETREWFEKVAESMRNLPPGMRNAVALRARGHSYLEIAHILQVSVNTVKSQLHAARKRLQEELQSDLGGIDF